MNSFNNYRIKHAGLFDSSSGIDYLTNEIVKCIDLAKNGIHAVLLVFSVKNRFSQEEEATVKTLKNLFGPKILDYAITVFTGGDEFDEEEEVTFEDYLRDCPVALKDILAACKNRCVLFDNKSRSGSKNAEQVNNLLSMVNEVIAQNGGQAFTHSLFLNSKIEEKVDEVRSILERQIAKEREARRKAEEELKVVQNRLEDRIQEHDKQMHAALQRPVEVKIVRKSSPCTIV